VGAEVGILSITSPNITISLVDKNALSNRLSLEKLRLYVNKIQEKIPEK
jgi:hypothetical protein